MNKKVFKPFDNVGKKGKTLIMYAYINRWNEITSIIEVQQQPTGLLRKMVLRVVSILLYKCHPWIVDDMQNKMLSVPSFVDKINLLRILFKRWGCLLVRTSWLCISLNSTLRLNITFLITGLDRAHFWVRWLRSCLRWGCENGGGTIVCEIRPTFIRLWTVKGVVKRRCGWGCERFRVPGISRVHRNLDSQAWAWF